jgi:NAD(P)-dependent dehydrogenase (short-subunit alcohol dehydrogenase family)
VSLNAAPKAATLKSLAGRKVFITGGAKRIGRSIALALAEAGADVVITYRGSQAEAEQTVSDLTALGSKASAQRCDVRDEASVNEAVSGAVETLGGLDILINNAGAFQKLPLEEITLAQWDDMYAINVRGPFLVAKAAYPHLKAVSGRIVNLGSLGGIEPWAAHGHYCSSKAALHMLSQTMAKAWAPEVSVNCVAPGMIEMGGTHTPYANLGDVSSVFARFAERTPMRRNGTAEEIAEAVLFFATASSFVTGQLLVVDGGLGL